MKRRIALFLTLILLLVCINPSASYAKSSLNYKVTVNTSGEGSLYWDHGKSLDFFLTDGAESYNPNCLIKNGTSYSFSTLVARSIIPEPAEGWYFDGFYDKNGNKLSIKGENYDIVRVTVKGLYFYDYVPSNDSSLYKNYTKTGYQNQIRAYLKGIYGTTRYKVMKKIQLYSVPRKDADLYPRFLEKTSLSSAFDKTINKTYGDGDFSVWRTPDDSGITFSSSNSKVLTIDKTTGLCKIKGEGIAKITVKVPDSDKYKKESFKIKVTVKPPAMSGLSAKKNSDGTIEVKWSADTKASGYEIQVGTSTSFSKISAKKNVSSGKTTNTKIKPTKNAVCKAVRIRAVKRSCGEKLYSPYLKVTIK